MFKIDNRLPLLLCLTFLCFPFTASCQFFYIDWGGDNSIRRIEADGSANNILLDSLFQVNTPTELSAPNGLKSIFYQELTLRGLRLQRADYEGKNITTVIEPEDFNEIETTSFEKYFVDGVNKYVYYLVLGQPGWGLARSGLSGENLTLVMPFGSPVFNKGAYTFNVDAAEGKIYVQASGSLVRSNLDGSSPQTILVSAFEPGTCVFPGEGKIVLPPSFNDPELMEMNSDGSGRRSIVLPIDAFKASHSLSSVTRVLDLAYDFVSKSFFASVFAIRETSPTSSERVMAILSFDRIFTPASAAVIYIYPEERSSRRVDGTFVVASSSPSLPEEPIISLSPFAAFGVSFNTKANVRYAIQFKDNLAGEATPWSTLQTIEGTGGSVSIYDPEISRTPYRIYRAVAQ